VHGPVCPEVAPAGDSHRSQADLRARRRCLHARDRQAAGRPTPGHLRRVSALPLLRRHEGR
jgi:hypothetical protein